MLRAGEGRISVDPLLNTLQLDRPFFGNWKHFDDYIFPIHVNKEANDVSRDNLFFGDLRRPTCVQ